MIRAATHLLLSVVCTVVVFGAGGLGEAAAAPLPSTSLGVNVKIGEANGQFAPADLSVASAAGAGVVRLQAIQGTDMDGIVQWLAESHMRLYPILGLPCPTGTTDCTPQTQIPPGTAASEMAQYIAGFAQRYGPKGTFWTENPSLPYLPVESFEIGNEPNIPRLEWVQDSTHLHWTLPGNPDVADDADYAEVYEASWSALHKVDPSGKAVVGGLADSAGGGVDVQSDEAVLAALARGGVDTVGYHPWVSAASDSLLEPDTTQLRTWMNQNGYSTVPLDVNEFGACWTTATAIDKEPCPGTQSSATWGYVVAGYTTWALCTPSLNIENVQPFFWGATPTSDQDIWLPLVTSAGAETVYGQDFLNVAKSLTTTGCTKSGATSASASSGSKAGPKSGSKAGPKDGSKAGSTSGSNVDAGANAASKDSAPASGLSESRLSSMGLRVVQFVRRGRRVSATVRHARGSGTVTMTVARRGRKHGRISKGRRRNATTTTFSAKLTTGRWLVSIGAKPARGYARPKPKRRRYMIRKVR